MLGGCWDHRAATRYAQYGVLFGVCFPAGSLLFLWWSGDLAGSGSVWGALATAHHVSRLLPVVDTAPLFLGWFAYLVGARQDRIERLNLSLRGEVAERTRALDALHENHALVTAVMEGTTDALWVKGADGTYRMINGAGARAFGSTAAGILGRTDADLFSPESADAIRRHDRTMLAAGTPDSEESEVTTVAGETRTYLTTRAPLTDGAGRVVGVIGVSRDVTERRALEAKLAHQAFHDSLTGLANRTLFRERVAHALAHVERGSGAVAVLFVDLDDFKTVNDSLGHAEGDRLLQVVAARLLRATRGCDTVARLGGDEFAILLDGIARPQDALTVVDRVTGAMRAPVPLQGREVLVRASVGLAHARDDDTADDLLRNADVAMYRAKAAGKGRHTVFEPGMHEAALHRLELEGDLREAVGRDELRLAYQPIVELASGRVLGLEALLRWQHPALGLVPPATFIPLAEETGLIVPIGRWVLAAACEQLRAWDECLPDGEALGLSVNISGRQLEDDALIVELASILARTGVPANRLTLEITESVVMRRLDDSLRRLRALKALGVRLAIDDFGTGYSSLSYLQRFPVDVLKIDKSFVGGVADGASGAALAKTIIALGDALGLHSVAEGVETEAQRVALDALGCAGGQGYHFARPMPAGGVPAFLHRSALLSPA